MKYLSKDLFDRFRSLKRQWLDLAKLLLSNDPPPQAYFFQIVSS